MLVAAAEARAAQDPTALARTGTAAIESRRFGDALEAFTRAAAMQPGDASLCFGAGVAAFMLGQNDVAQTRFECAWRAIRTICRPQSGSRTSTIVQAVCTRPSRSTKPHESDRRTDVTFRTPSRTGGKSTSCRAASTSTHGALHGAVRGGHRRTTCS